MDQDVNFGELWAQFDILLMGRRTYEAAIARLGKAAMQRMKTVVVSRTLRLIIIPELNRDQMHPLRAQSVKDIWLSGGWTLSCSAGNARRWLR
jgi:dihydrofolate reductase